MSGPIGFAGFGSALSRPQFGPTPYTEGCLSFEQLVALSRLQQPALTTSTTGRRTKSARLVRAEAEETYHVRLDRGKDQVQADQQRTEQRKGEQRRHG